MANRLNYEIGFSADTSQLKGQMREVQRMLQEISDFSFLNNQSFTYTKEIQEASEAAKDLQLKLQQATNIKTGSFDLTTFRQSLERSGVTLQDYANRLVAIGPQGQQAFYQVANAISQAELPTKRMNSLMNELWITMKNTMRWQITSSALHGFMGALQTSYGYAKDLNSSLNNIRIVSGQSAEQMAEFAKQANKAAKELSTTTVDYTDAALIYYQQGLPDEEVEERTNATIKMANVTGDAVEDVSSQLTAIWNNFYDGTKSLEYYADVITALGAATASSTSEISDGLEKFAAIGETIGLSYEYATASLATIVSQTRQAPETVGTALKTIFARIQGLSLGETLDDGTNLNKYSDALSKVGVSIFDTNGQLKDMDAIIDELGSKWDTLNKAQQMALAQTVAGVRQYTQLIAFLDNYDSFQENLNIAMESEGALDEQADIYAESWRAAAHRVKAAAEGIYDSLLEDEAFISLLDLTADLLTNFEKLVDGLGGLEGALSLTSVAFTRLFGDKIANSMRDFAYNLKVDTGEAYKLNTAMKQSAADLAANMAVGPNADYASVQSQKIAMQLQLNDVASNLTEIQVQQLQNEIEYFEFLGRLKVRQDEIAQSAEHRLNESKQLIEQFEQTQSSVPTVNLQKAQWRTMEQAGVKGQAKNNDLSDLANTLDGLISQNTKLNGVIEKINSLNQSFNNGAVDANEYERQISELQSQINEFGFRAKDATGKKLIDIDIESDVQKGLGQLISLRNNLEANGGAIEYLRNRINNYLDVLEQQGVQGIGAVREQLEQMTRASYEAAEAGLNSRDIVTDLDKMLQQYADNVQSAAIRNYDWAFAIQQTGNVLSGFSLAVASAKTLIEQFEAGEIDIITATTSLTAIFGGLAQTGTALKDIWTGLNVILNANTLSTGQNTVAKILNNTASVALDTTIGKLIIKTKLFTAATTSSTKVLTLSLGLIGAVVVGIGALVGILDLVTTSQKEASEAIKKANENYSSQKEKLDELNNTLETTKERIEELSKQDSLTIVEQEELDKLKQEEALLRQRIKLQERQTKIAQEAQVDKISTNYSKAYTSVAEGPKLTRNIGGTQTTAEDWFNAQTLGLDKSSKLYEHALSYYEEWIQENKTLTAEWLEENKEAFDQAENDYLSYIEYINNNPVAYDESKISEMQEVLKQMRLTSLGDSEAEYYEFIIKPILDTESLNTSLEIIYEKLSSGEAIDAKNFVTEPIKEALLYAGISIDDFLNSLNDKIDTAVQNAKNIGFTDKDFAKLSADDYEFLFTINWDNIDSANELWDAIENYRNTNIEIEVEVTGLEKIKALNTEQEALEQALEDYQKQGHLSSEQVTELIAKNADYAKYIVKVGDSYKLNKQILMDYQASEKEEKAIIDDLITQYNTADEVIKTYAQDIANAYLEINQFAKQDTDFSFDLKNFESINRELAKSAELYSKNEIASKDYLHGIAQASEAMAEEFNKLSNENLVKDSGITDVYEAQFTQMTAQVTAGLNDLDREFATGKIHMDDYNEGLLAGVGALASLHRNLNEGSKIRKNSKGEWEAITVELGNLTEAEQKAAQAENDFAAAKQNELDANYKQLDSMRGLNEVLVENYDYLSQFADELGVLDFDTTIEYEALLKDEQFTTAIDGIAEKVSGLYATNREAYDNIIDSMNAAGADLSTNLQLSGDELAAACQKNINVSEAMTNSAVAESGRAITNSSSAIGGILESLGSAIKNFNYKISFSPTTFEPGQFDIEKFIESRGRQGFVVPKFGWKISGKLDGKSSDVVDAIKNAANYFTAAGSASRSGYHRYGTSPTVGTNNTLLDPDEYELEGGKRKKGKGSGGGKASTEKLKEIKERYHEITEEIEYHEELLDKIDKQTDKTYGLDKIKLYNKQQEELNKLLELNEQKKLAAFDDIAVDLEELKNLGLNPEVDLESSNLTNYTQMLNQVTNDYNKYMKSYNAMSKKQQEAHEKEKKAIEEKYDKQIKALEQYEKTVDTYREQLEKWEDLQRELEDSKLTELNAKLELVLDLKEAKDEVRDFAREIIESFGDEITHGAESLQNQFTGALANMDLTDDFSSQQAGLIDLINNANKYTNMEDLSDSLDDLRGEIISTGEALLDWLDTLENAFPEAIDAARERFQVFTGELSHNKNILDTMKEIVELQNSIIPNQTKQDKYSFIDKATSSQLEAVMGQAQLEKKRYDESREALELAWQVLQGYDEGDAGYDGAYNNWVALLAENQEAEQAWLNKTKEAMEQAQAIYLNAIENISYNFEQAITNNMGLDLLQDKYDNYIEEEERYLDEVNELYEINKYNNKLQKDIDNTTNQVHRAQLQALQQEIEARAENNKLSEYDLQIMEAKYNALQKQIALEEAQNNKSEVRLRRDAQGNWSYAFTANQDEIAAAEQELADANNEYYNIAKQEVKDVTGEIIATWQEMNDKIKEVYEDESLTVAEREAKIAEIREYYKNKILDLEEQKNIALEDMTAAGSETIQNFGNEYGDTLNNMADVSDNFAETFDNYIQEMEDSLKEYEKTTLDIGHTTETTYGQLEEQIDATSNSTEYFTEVGLDATDMMWDQLDALQEQINGYLAYADAVMEAVRALQQLANQNVQVKENMSQSSANSTTGFYDKNTDYMALGIQAAARGDIDAAMGFLYQREDKVEGEGLGSYNAESDRSLMEAIANLPSDKRIELIDFLDGEYTTKAVMNWLRKEGIALETGGYTGIFDGAKAALLHEKELVLNQKDTENILNTVSAVRTLEPTLLKAIERMLDINAMNSLRSMGSQLSTISSFTAEPGVLEQMLNITAEFPNAVDQNEIREAILGLANYATQFVNKR